jgi:hypothetical protein
VQVMVLASGLHLMESVIPCLLETSKRRSRSYFYS